MSKPRQEFLGPITKLAAIDTNGVWSSDGYGIVDGYEADIVNISNITFAAGDYYSNPIEPHIIQLETSNHGSNMTVKAQNSTVDTGGTLYLEGGSTTSGTGGPVIIKGGYDAGSALTIKNATVSINSCVGVVGNTTNSGTLSVNGILALKNSSKANPQEPLYSSNDYSSIQTLSGSVIGQLGVFPYGSYTIVPSVITSNLKPQKNKQFGSFIVYGSNGTGSASETILTFSTDIHGEHMPASSILVGKFMLGWMGNGNYTDGGAIDFLFTITSDASGYINRWHCSLDDDYVDPGNSTIIVSGTSFQTHNDGSSMWILPTPSLPPYCYVPQVVIRIPAANTRNFALEILPTQAGTDENWTNCFWEIEYGWGISL